MCKGYLAQRPTVKSQATLPILAVLPEPSRFAHTIYEPHHEKTGLCHMRTTMVQISLYIRLDSIIDSTISILAKSKISRL